VIGIVASRIAERHHRPCVLIALDGDEGTGSGRSIPGFDLLGGLDASAAHLIRHGGHRAAAGCTIARTAVDGFRAAFNAHAGAVLTADDLVRRERVDAVVAGDELGLELAEELATLAPFGIGNPQVSLLLPAARLTDPRPMGEGKHLRFTVEAGGVRARAVAFGMSRLPDGAGEAVDATFTLELNEWNGAVEPRLVLRHAQPASPGEITLVGEPEDDVEAALRELTASSDPDGVPEATGSHAAPAPRDRRGGGIAGTVAGLVASGEPVLVVAADARRRSRHLAGRLGGFAVCSWQSLARDPGLAGAFAHVVALDPPATHVQAAALAVAGASPAATAVSGPTVHLAWGPAEIAFALKVAEHDFDLRSACTDVYRALRTDAHVRAAVEAAGSARRAGHALRVLCEVGLIAVDHGTGAVVLPPAERTELERSAAFRVAEAALAEARRRLGAYGHRPGPALAVAAA
jgi:single-stranded-DNA-specific exonuclease